MSARAIRSDSAAIPSKRLFVSIREIKVSFSSVTTRQCSCKHGIALTAPSIKLLNRAVGALNFLYAIIFSPSILKFLTFYIPAIFHCFIFHYLCAEY